MESESDEEADRETDAEADGEANEAVVRLKSFWMVKKGEPIMTWIAINAKKLEVCKTTQRL